MLWFYVAGVALISIIFDPQDPADVSRARAELDRFEPPDTGPAGVRSLCQQMLDPRRYGKTRRLLVRAIAEASPSEISRDAIREVAQSIDDSKNPGQVVGGLHSNLEASWRSFGGPGEFVETKPTGMQMRPDLAEIVLTVLDDQDRRNCDNRGGPRG